ncbi:MAG: anthrax toxin lethal factor-related metalloendopeptidase [Candidatus Hodarchaeales archaeon]
MKKSFNEVLSNIPKKDKKYIKKVVFSNKSGKGKTAEFDRRTNHIIVYKEAVTKPQLSVEKSILHEIGHSIWFNKIWKGKNAKKKGKEYYRIWEKEKVSKYATKNYSEGFAEAYAYYRLVPNEFKRMYPETYKFMKEIERED